MPYVMIMEKVSVNDEQTAVGGSGNVKAMQMADTSVYWLESQPEANSCHLIFMRQVKEIASKN